MSWWTKLRDTVESAASTVSPIDIRGESARKSHSGISGAANKLRSAEEGLVNKITGRPNASEKREQANLINEQIRAYKEQSEIARQEMERVRGEQEVEKRRINEKQIRSLRNRYRAPSGFLNNRALSTVESNPTVENKLGG